jgi:radical SAM protein with 4Fe4S-binding SPASM domain
MGCAEVTLIGGEAYLHPDVLEIVAFLATRGVRVGMQTGGRGLTRPMTKNLATAGMVAIGVSVDGPPRVHDVVRAAPGSFRAAIAALNFARDEGMVTSVNTQVNALSADHLRETLELLKPTGIAAWRCQLTAPMGRAADRPDWILPPWKILQVIDTLAELQLEIAKEAQAKGIPPRQMLDVQLGNNLGYFGPHELVLRSRPGGVVRSYQGCTAGSYVMGIESDGTVKGCPSLPTAPYAGGNVRDLALEEIWQDGAMTFTRESRVDELWGFCKTCMYAEVCQAGCSFTAHTTLGRRGNNPFCYYRAATLKKRGRREVLVHKERAAGTPYDFGRFEIREEDWSEA